MIFTVYHHSDIELKEFKDNFVSGYAAKHGVNPNAKFFLGEPAKEEFLSDRPICNQYNILCLNPYIIENNKHDKAISNIREGVNYAFDNGYDSAIFYNIWDNRIWCDVFVVFSNSQIQFLK